ncbi:MAG: hypothetical protein MJE77_24935 [Proteobacteria bacterium]|nr:hypothetical protein [Pseudomonadota bacterium]
MAINATADEDLATGLLNLLDDLSTRNVPDSLAVDADQIVDALASVSERIETLRPQVEQLSARFQDADQT